MEEIYSIKPSNLMKCNGQYYKYDENSELWIPRSLNYDIKNIYNKEEFKKDYIAFSNKYVLIIDSDNKKFYIEELRKDHYCYKEFHGIEFIKNIKVSVNKFKEVNAYLSSFIGKDTKNFLTLIMNITFNSGLSKVIYLISNQMTFLYEALQQIYMHHYETWLYENGRILKKKGNYTSRFIFIICKNEIEFNIIYDGIKNLSQNMIYIMINANKKSFDVKSKELIFFNYCDNDKFPVIEKRELGSILLSMFVHMLTKKK
jgi:hypothetical protein